MISIRQLLTIFLIPSSLALALTHMNHPEITMSTLSYAEASALLAGIGESHILEQWHVLNSDQQQQLLKEIEELNVDTFKSQQHSLQQHLEAPKQELPTTWDAFDNYNPVASENNQQLGLELLAQGKVGCVLVAGGQGTRLSYEAPKGTFPVTLIRNKSLFQVFAEKTIAAGKQVNRLLPLAIMTSPQNHAATLAFFRENNHFGLAEEQLYFFTQTELPLLDNQGHLILKNECSIAKGPDGNGGSLSLLISSGIWETWRHQGIQYINYILIDNPLADPFDAELIGFHAKSESEITVKCVERTLPNERVGLLVKADGGVCIVEYSEMADSERTAVQPDGRLKHRCTNISLFCFSMEFIKKAAATTSMPWHFAHKAAYLNGPFGWKFETYIFDYLAATRSIKALLYPRAECFAPLKNGTGSDSLQTVQEALLEHDRTTLESICGYPLPHTNLELDQQFHYPTAQLLAQWKGRKGPFQGYITADDKTDYTKEPQ